MLIKIEDPTGGRTTTGPRVVLALSALWMVIALYSVHSVLPTNVLELPFDSALAKPINGLAPQGWAFFTKSPRDSILTAYTFDQDGEASRVPEITASDHRNLFGINRRGRAIGTELAQLLTFVPADRWVECEPAAADCLSQLHRSRASYQVMNPVPGPRLCGEVALAEESVVPYAYRELVERRVIVERAAYLVVECEP